VAKVLITVWPFTGHLHPNLAVADALRRRGHEVAFYTGASARALVEGEGFACFPFRAVDEAIVNRLALSEHGILSARRQPWRMKALWKAWVLDTVPQQIADLETVLDAWSPDALVCDPTLWGPFLVLAEARHIPVAVFGLVPACHLAGVSAPVLGFAAPPPRTAIGRLSARIRRAMSDAVLADTRRAARALRGRYGLPPFRGSVTDFAGRMPLYLVPGSPEFDYSRDDLPPSVRYVGPCIWSGAAGRAAATTFVRHRPDWPLVYVSEGTVNLEPRVLRAAAQGLANLDVEVVLSTGRHRDPESLDLGPRPLAANIRVEPWVPYGDLLPQLAALVTIGGPSTLLPALQAGIPAVVVPFDWDHPETAWRVHVSGAGIRLTPRGCTPGRMRDAVMRLLTDPIYRQHAERIGATFRRCGGAPEAARLIETLVPMGREVPALEMHDACSA
jgi:MGT family glycosyltransferase